MIGGYKLGVYLTGFSDKAEAQVEESHALGDAWIEQTWTGVKQTEVTVQGFYDDEAVGQHEAIGNTTKVGSTAVLCYGVEGNTSGAAFVGWSAALQQNYTRSPERGALTKIESVFQLAQGGLVDQGRILRPLAGATATGNTTAQAIDFTASATAGGAAYLQVYSNVGNQATAMAVDIMHSADNLAFTSWAGFAGVSSTAPSAQRISSTAPLQRYAAARWTAGTGFGTSAVFMVGLARAT